MRWAELGTWVVLGRLREVLRIADSPMHIYVELIDPSDADWDQECDL